MAGKLTKEACRAARALLGLTTQQFATRLGISPTTVNGIEAGNPVRESTERKVMEALDALGVEITNGNGTGARLRFADQAPHTGLILEPRPMKRGAGWCVFLRWEDGESEQIDGFASEAAAAAWVANDSAAWIAERRSLRS